MDVASCVMLNDRFTAPFPISRSIRQGCPLSTLLFAVAMEVLSNMIADAVRRQHLHGVSFAELDYQIAHDIYADDIHLFI